MNQRRGGQPSHHVFLAYYGSWSGRVRLLCLLSVARISCVLSHLSSEIM